MKRFIIILCQYCNKPSLCFEGSMVKTCPYCGKKTGITINKIAARASSPEEAKTIISALKKRKK